MPQYNSFIRPSKPRFIPQEGYTILCANDTCLHYISRGAWHSPQCAFDNGRASEFKRLSRSAIDMLRDSSIDLPHYPGEYVYLPAYSVMLERLSSK